MAHSVYSRVKAMSSVVYERYAPTAMQWVSIAMQALRSEASEVRRLADERLRDS